MGCEEPILRTVRAINDADPPPTGQAVFAAMAGSQIEGEGAIRFGHKIKPSGARRS